MTTLTDKTGCVTCGKDKVAYKCKGCLQTFCLNHLNEHHRELGQQLNDIENQRNLFRQTLTEQNENPQKYCLVQKINKWENESIEKIHRTAEEARQLLIKHVHEHINNITIKLTELTEKIKQIRDQDSFNEIHLKELNEKLKQLEEEFNQPANIVIGQESSSFIKRISVQIYLREWIQDGITIAGGNKQGNGLNQLSQPWSVDVDDDQTLYITDCENHRIMKWTKGATNGQVVVGKHGKGNRNDQLNEPRNVIVDKQNDCLFVSDTGNRRVMRWPCQNGKTGEIIISNINCWGLAMDDTGYLYTSDIDNNEVRRWKIGEKIGVLVAGGNGQGNRLDQFSNPYFISVDTDHSIYVSDYGNHRVMKWMKGAKQGLVVAGGHGHGNDLTRLSYPLGIVIDRLGTLYIADHCNHRVMRWLRGAKEGSVIVGGNGCGTQTNQFNSTYDLSFDRQNNLYIVDYGNQRVQKFDIK